MQTDPLGFSTDALAQVPRNRRWSSYSIVVEGSTELDLETIVILEHEASGVGADQHVQVVKIEHSDWMSVRVKHAVIGDPVLACTRQDHGIHVGATPLASMTLG